MPQLLALEWNGNEARAAVGSRHGMRTVIEQAFAIPLSEEGASDIGGQIATALADRGLGSLDALVAVGRGSVELRQLQLPYATDEDLPKMVRLQALLEFNALDETWPLDFLPLDAPGKDGRTVLAAAIPPEMAKGIQDVCQQSGLKMRRLLLRSAAAAALAARAKTVQREQAQLLVELFSEQADLTVMRGGRLLFLRTTRLGSDSNRRQNLASEIRLTVAAVQNQCGGCKVTRIVLCGRGETDAALAKQIEKDTAAPTVLLDPFAGLELGQPLRASPPADPGRFAAVLGMLLTELDGSAHAIDFLNPRRVVESKPPRNKWKLAAMAAGALLLAYLVYGRIEHWWLAAEVSGLEAQSRALDRPLAAAEKVCASFNDLSKWTDGEVVWLDHLRVLSGDFPTADNATLSRLALTASAATVGGEIQLEGRAKNAAAIAAMEQGLRKHAQRVVGISSHEDRSVQPYSWQFKTTVSVGREPKP